MPGTPELRFVDLHCIGEAVTIKQADGGLESSAVHSMKCLNLVVGCMFLSSLAYVSFNLSCNSVCGGRSMHLGQSRTWHDKSLCSFFLFVSFRPLAQSVCSLLLCQKRSERITALG